VTPAARGLLAGLAVGLAVGALAGSSRVEGVVRSAAGGVVVDIRVDEPVLGRLIRPAVGTVGEVRVVRRSWVVASTYEVSLHPSPQAAEALAGVRVAVRLPGRIRAAGAEISGGVATWDRLQATLQAQSRAVHWLRLAVVAAVVAAAWVAGGGPARRSPG
jgi:hypothetical protein